MKKKKSAFQRIISFIFLIISIIVLIKVFEVYKTKDFNDFVRGEQNLYVSTFTRDNEVKYTDKASYKIESKTPNDAMFYKTISVTPNTAYKVSCMVKTENVVCSNDNTGGGAQISVEGTTERSSAIKRN